MPSACKGVVKYRWVLQPDATLDQAAAVQNTWYTVLPTSVDARIVFLHYIIIGNNETVEYELTVDGVTRVGTYASIAATDYWPILGYTYGYANSLNVRVADRNAANYTFFEGRSVRVRMRKTTAAGATTLRSLVVWERLEQV